MAEPRQPGALHARIWARWNEWEINRLLRVWEGRIGREATETNARALCFGQLGLLIGIVWVVLNVALGLSRVSGVYIAIGVFLFWPFIITFLFKAARGQNRASRQAAAFLGLPKKAMPPIKYVEGFERYMRRHGFELKD